MMAGHEEALADLKQALELTDQPTIQFVIHTLMGWSRINLARYSEALQSLLHAEKLVPEVMKAALESLV